MRRPERSGDLEPWVQGTLRYGKRKASGFHLRLSFSLRKMGLEPTRYCYHKILSLARLPVPTLPHNAPRKNDNTIIQNKCQFLFSKIPVIKNQQINFPITGILRSIAAQKKDRTKQIKAQRGTPIIGVTIMLSIPCDCKISIQSK